MSECSIAGITLNNKWYSNYSSNFNSFFKIDAECSNKDNGKFMIFDPLNAENAAYLVI